MAPFSNDSTWAFGRIGAIAARYGLASFCAIGLCTTELYRADALAQEPLPSPSMNQSLQPLGSAETIPNAETFPGVLAPSVLDQEAEIPEEILRTEIITEARSPFTGEPMAAAEYARLQAELEAPANGNLVNPNIRYLIFLLEFRRQLKPILPFL